MSFAWSSETCRVMGILNITPDSFSDGNEFLHIDKAIARALEMQKEGADVIDIGAESTRPGSQPVSIDLQLERIIPVVKALKQQSDIPISVDTTRAEVARIAIAEGATIVNDTSAGMEDAEMLSTVANLQCPVVLMHRSASPIEMQQHTNYENVVSDVFSYLFERACKYEEAGLASEKICLDPGIGFGKTPEQNIELTRNLSSLTQGSYAVLYGASRKSFIGHILQLKEPKDRDIGSVTVGLSAADQGVDWLRVHNVKDTVLALKMQEALT